MEGRAGRGRGRWTRRLVRWGAPALLVLTLLYLAREPLLAPLLGRLAGKILSAQAGLPLHIESVGGTWFTSLEVRGISSGPAGAGTLRRLRADLVRIDYSLPELVRAGLAGVKGIRTRGVELTLATERAEREPAAPVGEPFPLAELLALGPSLDLAVKEFRLQEEGGEYRVRELRLLRAAGPSGAGSIEIGRLSLPWEEPPPGPFRAAFTHRGLRITLDRARLGGVTLAGEVDFGRARELADITAAGRLRLERSTPPWQGEGELRCRLESGEVILEEFRARLPGLEVTGEGRLTPAGGWRGALACRFTGAQPLLERFTGKGGEIRGKVDLHLGGDLTGPTGGEGEVRLERAAWAGWPPLADLAARLAYTREKGLVVDRLACRLWEGQLQVRGRLDPTGPQPAWQGEVRARGLRPDPEWTGLGPALADLDLTARGRGPAGEVEADGALLGGGATTPRSLALALAGSFRVAGELTLDLARLRGRIEGRRLELADPARVTLGPGGGATERLVLLAGDSRLELAGTYPGTGPDDRLRVAVDLGPELPSRLGLAGPARHLRRAGLTGPRGMRLEGELGRGGLEFTLGPRPRKGEPLRLQARPVAEGTTTFRLEGRPGTLAHALTLEGRLPLPFGVLYGQGPEWSRALGPGLELEGRIEGLRPEQLPLTLPCRGAMDATLSLKGGKEGPGLTLDAGAAALTLDPALARSAGVVEGPWQVSLRSAWDREGLQVRGELRAPSGPSLLLSAAARTPFDLEPGRWIDRLQEASGSASLKLSAYRPPPHFLPAGLELRGGADLALEAAGTFTAWRASLTATAGALHGTMGGGKKHPLLLRRTELEARIGEGRLALELKGLPAGESAIEARLAGPIDQEALLAGSDPLPPAGKIEGRLDLKGLDAALLLPLLPDLRVCSGRITAAGDLAGTWAAPAPRGELTLEGGFLKARSTLPALHDIRARVLVAPDRVEIDELTAGSAGGTLAVRGGIDRPFTRPTFDLALTGREALLVRSGGIRARADLDLTLKGTLQELKLGGKGELTSGRLYRHVPLLAHGIEQVGRSVGRVPQIVGMDQLRRIPQAGGANRLFTIPGPLGRRTTLDMEFRTRRPFQLETNLLRTGLHARLRLKGQGSAPWFEGEITGAEEGRLALPGLTLKIRNLRLSFPPENPLEPRLQLMADGRKRSTDLNLTCTGPVRDLVVELYSQPPHPRRDLLVFALTGHLPGTISGREAALGYLGNYFGGELLERLAGGDDGGEGAWYEDRLTIEFGTEVSREGRESILAEFRLVDALFLQAERDIFGGYNLGLGYRWRWK